MLTPKISGIFDCRKYDQSGKKAHDQREMLAETDNVTFGALVPINDVPEVFITNGKLDEFCKPKATKKERAAASQEGRDPVDDVVSVKFKIGQNCKWYDKHAKPIDKPSNVELDARRYNVQIDFTRKEKNAANPLAPSGYWVNAIMISPIEANPFQGQAFEEAEDENDAPAEQPEQKPKPKTESGKKEDDDDLPF